MTCYPNNYPTPAGAELRGTIGDTVYSRNRYGPFSYPKAAKYDPNTGFQQTVRGAFADAVYYWHNTITPTQKAAWADYAANVPWTNRLGAQTRLSAFNWFVGTSCLRDYTGLYPRDAPTFFSRASLRPPTYSEYIAPIWVLVTVNQLDIWRLSGFGGMLVCQSSPTTVNVHHPPNSYVRIGTIYGSSTSPPTQRLLALRRYPSTATPRIFFRARVADQFNRTSPPVVAYLDYDL